MRSLTLAIAALAFLNLNFCCEAAGENAAAGPSETSVQAIDGKKATAPENTAPENTADKNSALSSNKPAHAEEQEGNEFWPPVYGYRLKVTDTLLTAFTFLLFLATLALWLATRGLVKSADRNADLQLRAYVFVHSCRVVDFEIGKPVSISLVAKNSGQTPSHDTTIVAALRYRPKSDKRPLELESSTGNSSGSIGSDGTETTNLRSSAPLTREQSTSIANGEARLIVHGEINYRTVFGASASSAFKLHFDDRCLQRGDKAFHVASDGNVAV